MKKVFLMLLVVIVCINSYAADNAVQQRRNVRKAPFKKASTVNENQLSFYGTSLNMSYRNFAKVLKAKKYNVVDESSYYTRYKISGSAFGLSNCKIEGFPSDENYIYGVFASKTFTSPEVFQNARSSIYNYLNKAYPHYKEYDYDLIDENGILINYCHRSIYNKSNEFIGDFFITFKFVSDERKIEVTIKMIDHKNNEKDNENDSNYVENGEYDITKFTSSLFDKCILEKYEDYLRFIIEKNNKKYKIFAVEDDAFYIVDCLADNNTSLAEKKELMKRYFSSFRLSDNYFKDCTYKYFKELQRAYNEEQIHAENIKKKNEKALQEALAISSPGEYIFRAIEGLDNIIKYKKDGSYDRRYQMFRKAWNRGVGGSSSSGTNWDGLNDAQKSVIHQNDNAR